MGQHSLSPGVGYCQFDDCTLVLDTRRDRYWQLDADAGALLAQLSQTGETMADETAADDLLEGLLGLGLVVAGPSEYKAGSLPAPRRSLLEESGGRSASVRDTIEIAGLAIGARVGLRFRRLDVILAGLLSRRRSNATAHAPLAELARRFEQARSLIPLAPRCLPDTLAWLAFTARRGHVAHLVFGVRSSPFQAHCWAQLGDTVLNDALDHARRFSPILIV